MRPDEHVFVVCVYGFKTDGDHPWDVRTLPLSAVFLSRGGNDPERLPPSSSASLLTLPLSRPCVCNPSYNRWFDSTLPSSMALIIFLPPFP